MFPKRGPLWKEMPVSRAFSSTYPSGSPAREPSTQIPSTELPQRETLDPSSSFQPYLKVPSRGDHSSLPTWAPMTRESYPQSIPFITFRVPSKGAPHQVPLKELPSFQNPLSTNSQSSRWTDPPWHWRVMSVPWALLPMSFRIPRKELS